MDAESYEMDVEENRRVTNERAERQWDEFLHASKATLKKMKNTKLLPEEARDAYKQLKDSHQKSSQMRKVLQEEAARLNSQAGSLQPEMFYSSRIFDQIAAWQAILAVAQKYEMQELYTTRVLLARANPHGWQPKRLAEWHLRTGENIIEEEDWASGKVPLQEWEKLAQNFNLAPSIRFERARNPGAALFLEESKCGKHYFAGFPPNQQEAGCSPSVKSRVIQVDPLWS